MLIVKKKKSLHNVYIQINVKKMLLQRINI